MTVRSRAVARYVSFLGRNDRWIALGAAALFVVALLVARRLELRSDFTELLPQDDPDLASVQRIRQRVGARATLIIAVEGPVAEANERFADALVGNLQPLVGTDLRAIDYRADTSRAFFEHNQALYADLPDLRRIDDDLRRLLASRKNPGFVTFADGDLGEQDDDPARDLDRLAQALARRKQAANRFPGGYYENADRSLLAIVTWTQSSGTGDRSGFRIRDDVQRAIDYTLRTSHISPAQLGAVTAHITGDVASAIEEHDALKSDVAWVSLLCTALVLAVIALYFRSVLSLGTIFFPTLLGGAGAFAIAALTVGYLNTNTAFLGSIILGNGINFGIILLARYREERRSRPFATIDDALAQAIARTALPTLGAALAAAIAYGSLALTGFRGFQQFGLIGGMGMILCWLATYSYGPALIQLRERVRRPTAGALSDVGGGGDGALARGAGGLLRHRRLLVGVVVGATLLGAASLLAFARDPFEYDFSRLRNQRSRKQGAGALYARVGRIFPQDIAPVGIALLPSAADAPAYREALLRKDCADGLTRARHPQAASPAALAAECARRVAAGQPTGGLLSAVATAYDYLPRDQVAKLAVIADIRRRLADPAVELVSPEDRKKIDAWAPPADLRALAPADLPEAIARRFRESDGATVGRVALIFPVRAWANWDGRNLIRLADVMKGVRLPGGAVVVDAAGHPTVFAAMLRSMAHDGPIATGAALAGVVLMVVLLFRRANPIGLVLASLAAGVVWMGGAGAALGIKLNFLNFVALPITLGIGVDYAVNIVARLRNEAPAGHARALARTGGAVALCSATTMIGYSSLLIASNGALRSFGLLADLGELGCLLAAVLLVPALMRRRSR